MRINKLELSNFRCFEQYELELADRFTLLIGDNGSGKTAILDAISKCLDLFIVEIPNIKSDRQIIRVNDVRINELIIGQSAIRDKAQNPTKIEVTGIVNDINLKWGRSREKGKSTGRRHSKQLATPVTDLISNRNDLDTLFPTEKLATPVTDLISNRNSSGTLFPIISYYTTARLWKEGKIREGKIRGIKTFSPPSRFDSYTDCLNTASDKEIFFNWFKTQELGALQKRERRHVLEAVREAIIAMIPDCRNIWWDMDWDALRIQTTIQGKKQEIPFHLLSDGYRNMIGMVADIAYRMATLNPQLEKDVIKQTEGIVLIDEIDLHLHPKWQRIVVERLLNTFPKVQFVATTHSPFIIQSVRQGKLIKLDDDETPDEYYDLSIEDIVETIQDVELPQKSQRYNEMLKTAEAYYKKLHECNNESDEALLKLRAELDELTIPFSDDPAFMAQLKFERDTVLANKGIK